MSGNDDEEDGSIRFSEDATQTDGDAVDGSALIQPHQLYMQNLNMNMRSLNGASEGSDGGFLSSLLTLVLSSKRNKEPENENALLRNAATQTEEQDPVCAKGQQLSLLLIQELALNQTVHGDLKDDVYESMASCICSMFVKHSILFNGMVRRFQVTRYHIFNVIANEIFEANESSQYNITWGRVVTLYAFAVRLAQEYRDDSEMVDAIIRYLASYVTKNLVPFVKSQGGWENLVEHFPVPVDEEAQFKRAIMWSGLCVGLMATMYVSSLLSSR